MIAKVDVDHVGPVPLEELVGQRQHLARHDVSRLPGGYIDAVVVAISTPPATGQDGPGGILDVGDVHHAGKVVLRAPGSHELGEGVPHHHVVAGVPIDGLRPGKGRHVTVPCCVDHHLRQDGAQAVSSCGDDTAHLVALHHGPHRNGVPKDFHACPPGLPQERVHLGLDVPPASLIVETVVCRVHQLCHPRRKTHAAAKPIAIYAAQRSRAAQSWVHLQEDGPHSLPRGGDSGRGAAGPATHDENVGAAQDGHLCGRNGTLLIPAPPLGALKFPHFQPRCGPLRLGWLYGLCPQPVGGSRGPSCGDVLRKCCPHENGEHWIAEVRSVRGLQAGCLIEAPQVARRPRKGRERRVDDPLFASGDGYARVVEIGSPVGWGGHHAGGMRAT